MAPRKGARPPGVACVYKELEKSFSSNCAAVLDAATAQIGYARLPLIAGITSKNDLWTVLHKYKTVCFSLENRVAFLSVLTDFCCGCAATPAIADPFLHDSNSRSLFALFDKLGKEWDYVFQAIHCLPRSKRFQECKIKAVHSIFSRWAALVDSSLMSKLQSRASETCFKMYGLQPLKRCYTAEKFSPNEENGEAPTLLNIKLEMKRVCLGSLQLKAGKDQLLQLYLGEEIVLGVQSAGNQEIGIVLRKEHLDGVVTYLGDDESSCGDVLFLYPNRSGCSVIMEALAQVTHGCPPPLMLAQGEDRRVLVYCKRKVKEEMVDNVLALLRRLLGHKVVEVDQQVSEALLNKRKKAAGLFSSGAKGNKRGRDEESLIRGKEAKVLKESGDQKIQNRKILESIENARLRCFKCAFETNDKSALNNHILSHFIKEFLKMLPSFNCPQCSYKNIDRKRLSYHYAFVHMKILDFVTLEQLRGIAKDDTAKTMQSDCGVASNKHNKEVDCGMYDTKMTSKENNCGMYDAKMTSFYSSDSASDNFDESFSSLPDIDRSVGSNNTSSDSSKHLDEERNGSKSQIDESNQYQDKLDILELFPSMTKNTDISSPPSTLTITGKLVHKPKGSKLVLEGLEGTELDTQQMVSIKQMVKEEFRIASQQGTLPPTKVMVTIPMPIGLKESVQHHQSTNNVPYPQIQHPHKTVHEQIQHPNKFEPPQSRFGPPQILGPNNFGPPQIPQPNNFGLPWNNFGPPQISQQNNFGPSQIPQQNNFGPPQIPQQNNFGPLQIPQQNNFGHPQIPQQNKFGPSQIPQENNFGPPQICQQTNFGPPQIPQQNNFGPPQIPQRNNFGPPQIPQRNNFRPPQIPQQNNFGPPQIPQQSNFGPQQIHQQKNFKPPPIPQQNNFGPPQIPQQNNFGLPQILQQNNLRPPQIPEQSNFGPPQIPEQSNFWPPQIPERNNFGPLQIPEQNNFGPPQIPQQNNFRPPQIPQQNNFRLPQIPQQNYFGPPQIPQQNNFGPPQIPQQNNFGPPQIPQQNNFGPQQIHQLNNFGPPQITQQNNFGPPQMPQQNKFGPPQIQQSNNFGPPQKPQQTNLKPPQIPEQNKFGPPQTSPFNNVANQQSKKVSHEQIQQPKQVSNQQLQRPKFKFKKIQGQVLKPEKVSDQNITHNPNTKPKNVLQHQARKDKLLQPPVNEPDIPVVVPANVNPMKTTESVQHHQGTCQGSTQKSKEVLSQKMQQPNMISQKQKQLQKKVQKQQKLESNKVQNLQPIECDQQKIQQSKNVIQHDIRLSTQPETHHSNSSPRVNLQQHKELQVNSFGDDPSATTMTETKERYTNLPCGLVRIGSYPATPQDKKVVLHENWLEVRVRDVFQESVVTVKVDITEIQSALVSFSDVLPLLVLQLTPVSCAVLMEILRMNQKNKFKTNQGDFCISSNSRIDSNSRNETQKRMIFFLEKITKDAEKVLRNFLKDDLTELQETEAKEFFLRSGHVIEEDSLVLSDKKSTKEVELSNESSGIRNEAQHIPKQIENVTRKDPCKIGRVEESQDKSVAELIDKTEKEPSKNDVEGKNEPNKNEVVSRKLVPVQKYEGGDYWSEPWIGDLLRDINQGKVSIGQAASMTGTSYGIVYNKYVKIFGKIKRCK